MVTITFENGQEVCYQGNSFPKDEQAGMPDKYLAWPNGRVFFFGLTAWELFGNVWTKIPFLQENNDEVLGQRIVIES